MSIGVLGTTSSEQYSLDRVPRRREKEAKNLFEEIIT